MYKKLLSLTLATLILAIMSACQQRSTHSYGQSLTKSQPTVVQSPPVIHYSPTPPQHVVTPTVVKRNPIIHHAPVIRHTPTPVQGGNPFGYNFTPGTLIYSPPANFCTYFSCIKSFSKGKGYVEECRDGNFSKSGGIRGSCSSHGGDFRPLYAH